MITSVIFNVYPVLSKERKMYFRSLFWITMFVFPLTSLFAEESLLSIDRVIEVLEKTKQEILDSNSLFLKCEKNCYDMLHSKYSGGDISLNWELAWKDSSFYVKRLFRHMDQQSKNQDIFTSEEPFILLLKNKNLLNWNQGNSTCSIENAVGDIIINMINEWELFEYLGYNITEKIITLSGNNYPEIYEQKKNDFVFYSLFLPYLPDTLRKNSKNYSIRVTQESIDDHLCWVIEWSNHDMIWLDDRFIIRRRTIYHNDNIQYEISYKNHKEIRQDIWLPFNISVNIYSNTSVEPKDNWGKIAKKWVFEISDFKIDNVSDSLFDVTPLPGTLVVDGIRKETYRITEEGSDPFAGPIAQGLKVNRYAMFRAILIIVVSVLLLIGTWFLLRNK
jgi:hypothetical protein